MNPAAANRSFRAITMGFDGPPAMRDYMQRPKNLSTRAGVTVEGQRKCHLIWSAKMSPLPDLLFKKPMTQCGEI
jgi:hypothetical protein